VNVQPEKAVIVAKVRRSRSMQRIVSGNSRNREGTTMKKQIDPPIKAHLLWSAHNPTCSRFVSRPVQQKFAAKIGGFS
jgi:hypothetical protein